MFWGFTVIPRKHDSSRTWFTKTETILAGSERKLYNKIEKYGKYIQFSVIYL